MPKAYYIATRLKMPGSYRMRITVKPGDEANPLDVGETVISNISRDMCQEIHDAWEAEGYQMISELRDFLGLPQKYA